MKQALIISTLVAFPIAVSAQQAVPVNEGLQANPGEDFFKRAEQIYQLAIQAGEAKNKKNEQTYHNRAIKLLTDYLNKFPKHKNAEAATYYLGSSYYQLNQTAPARKLFLRVVNSWKKGPYVAQAANHLGYDAYVGKKYDLAAKYFGITAANATDPTDVQRSLFQQGQCHQITGKSDKAHASFMKILEQDKPVPLYRQQAHLRLGHLSSAEKEYVKAIQHFQALQRPEVPAKLVAEATFHVGLAQVQLKQFKEAETSYNKVLKIKDDVWKPHARIALMSARYTAKDYKGVIAYHRGSVAKLPKSLEAKRNILAGQAYLKLKQYNDARKAFEFVEVNMAGTMEAFEAGYRRILCYYNIKSEFVPQQVERFISSYGKQFGKHTYIHTARLLKAETLYDAKRYKEASAVYAQIDPNAVSANNRPGLLYKQGWCFAGTGNHQAAAKSFGLFIKSYPKDERVPQVLAMRGKTYMALDNKVSALRDFDAVIEKAPKSKLASIAWQSTAKLRKESKDYNDMVRRYRSLLTNFKDLPVHTQVNANYWIAWGYYKLEKHKNAIPYLTAATNLDKGAYKNQLNMLGVLCNFKLKRKDDLKKAVKAANLAGLADDVPVAIYRWLGIQCFSASEFPDAAHFLKRGVNAKDPRQTPVYYWRLLAKSQYENKHYNWALQAITHVVNLEEDPARIVEILLYKGLCLKGQKKVDEAIKVAKEAMEMNPSGKVKAELLILIGDLNFDKKEFGTAAQHYALIPNFYEDKELVPYALTRTIKSLEQNGQADEAKVYKEMLKKDFPNYKAP